MPRVTLAHWRDAAIVGALLLLLGNGLVSIAERTVPSGVAAVIVATVPLDVVLLQWLTTRRRPAGSIFGAIVIGLVGVALLIGPAAIAGEEITARTIIASAIIVVAVAIITIAQARNALRDRRERDADGNRSTATAAK